MKFYAKDHHGDYYEIPPPWYGRWWNATFLWLRPAREVRQWNELALTPNPIDPLSPPRMPIYTDLERKTLIGWRAVGTHLRVILLGAKWVVYIGGGIAAVGGVFIAVAHYNLEKYAGMIAVFFAVVGVLYVFGKAADYLR